MCLSSSLLELFSKNEFKRSDFLGIKTSMKQQVEKFLKSDHFDECVECLGHTIHWLPNSKDIFVPEKSIIGIYLKNDVKILFNNSTIVGTLNNTLRHCPSYRLDEAISFPIYIVSVLTSCPCFYEIFTFHLVERVFH